MGTIAEKGAYTIETKSLLKDKINNLGGSIDDNTTFRQYANQLQNVYDRLPKTEFEEGESVTLENCLKGKLDYDNGVVGIGQTEQDSTNGYQLINPSQLPLTTNGVTISKDTKGNIVLNGTPSISEGYINFRYSAYLNLSPNTYTLSVANKKVGIGIIVSSSEFGGGLNLTFADTSKSKSKAISNNTSTDVQVNVRYDVGTLNNFILNPMLEEGSTAHDYELYTGGQASPNPNYDQEIKYVRGKNRFDSEIEVGAFNNSGLNSPADNRLRSKSYVKVAPNTTYTLSWATTKNARCDIIEYAKNDFTTAQIKRVNNGYVTSPLTFTTSSTTNYIRLYIASTGDSSTSITDISNIQLEGATSTPYLPYNTIEEVVSGKNLFEPVLTIDGTDITRAGVSSISVNNGEYTLVASATDMYFGQVLASGSTYIDSRGVKIYANGNEKISYKISNTEINRMFITAYDSNGTSLGYVEKSGSSQGTYVFPTNCDFVTFRIGKGNAVSGNTYKFNVMVAYGDEIPTYEPYITPTSYQLSLGDIELNAIGNYTDELIYDVENDKVYKNEVITRKILTGANTEYWQVNAITGAYVFSCGVTNYKRTNELICMCNYFKAIANGTYGSMTDGQCRFRYYNDELYAFYVCMDDITNVNDFRTWLGTHNLDLYYVLATPQETEITDTTLINQIKALYNAHSNNGTTIITSNGNLPMIIKVRGLKGE